MFILIASIFIGFTLMTLVYMLPTDLMSKHVKKSIEIQMTEGDYPSLIKTVRTTRLDNFTDSLMLQNAIYDGKEGVILKSMDVYHYNFKDVEPTMSLIKEVSGEEPDNISSYTRYWHGYLVFLKPLLLLDDYAKVRLINMFLQITSLGILLFFMEKRKLRSFIPGLLFSLIFLTPMVMPLSLQFSTIYYVMIFSMIILLWKLEFFKSNNFIYLFLITGICTSFFDFLTYPIATLGMPLILIIISSYPTSHKQNLNYIVYGSLSWAFGYVGMWTGKWILSTILLQKNVFMDAFNSIIYRTSNMPSTEAGLDNLTVYKVIKQNFSAFPNIHFIILFIVILIFCWHVYKNNILKLNKFSLTKITMPYIICSALPLFWYAAVKNHSFVHSWFTSRGLCVFVFGIISMLVVLNLYLQNLQETNKND